MIEATLRLTAEEGLFTLLTTEEFAHPRARYEVTRDGKHLLLTITAEDATALKTAVSSICRVITVYEKAKAI